MTVNPSQSLFFDSQEIYDYHLGTMYSNYNKCVKVVTILKDNFPNEIFALKKNTINISAKRNSRLCKNVSGGHLAHYHREKPPRICIRQKFLKSPECWSLNRYFGVVIKPDFFSVDVREKRSVVGTLGIVDLMCHEVAHHRTKGHGNKWKLKYAKFLHFMINQIISGGYY